MFVLIAWWELIRGNGWGWLWRVSDWCHLRKHLGRNATNYFKYLMGRYKWAPGGLYAEPHPPLTPKVRPSPASQSVRCTGPHL